MQPRHGPCKTSRVWKPSNMCCQTPVPRSLLVRQENKPNSVCQCPPLASSFRNADYRCSTTLLYYLRTFPPNRSWTPKCTRKQQPPHPTWKRPRGRPKKTWIHQLNHSPSPMLMRHRVRPTLWSDSINIGDGATQQPQSATRIRRRRLICCAVLSFHLFLEISEKLGSSSLCFLPELIRSFIFYRFYECKSVLYRCCADCCLSLRYFFQVQPSYIVFTLADLFVLLSVSQSVSQSAPWNVLQFIRLLSSVNVLRCNQSGSL